MLIPIYKLQVALSAVEFAYIQTEDSLLQRDF